MLRILIFVCATIAMNFLSQAHAHLNIKYINLGSASSSKNLTNHTSIHVLSGLNDILTADSIARSNLININLVSLTLEYGEMMDGRIVINATGGMPDYNYAWSHNIDLNSNTASDLSSGDYVVTVTDAFGCTASAEFFVGLITNTNDFELSNTISIHPNPVVNRFRVEAEGVEKFDELRLINNIGILLKSWKSIPSHSWIELHNISVGSYFLYFKIGNKLICKKILIK